MTPEFEYGPVAKGIFIALVCITPVILLLDYSYFFYYLLFLFFLGFGLRPFLVKSGLYALWHNMAGGAQEKWDKGYLEKRAEEIDRQQEKEKFRRSRYRDPKLPKNW
jgi:hypothetical protein